MLLRWLRSLFGRAAPVQGAGRRARSDAPKRLAAEQRPEWLKRVPQIVTAVDVETTGLSAKDRIVSLAALRLDTHQLAAGGFDLKYLHVVVNPERPNHPRAEAVHGYSDAVLKAQDRFVDHARQTAAFLADADLIVAHNAAFDLAFIDRELLAAGEAPIGNKTFCTMEGYKRSVRDGGASLDAVCEHIGIGRRGGRHDAMEDCWLSLMVYLWLQGCPYKSSMPDGFKAPELIVPQQVPWAERFEEATQTPEAQRIDDLVSAVKAAKREGRMVEAVVMLKAEVERQEVQSRATGLGVAPWYYEQLAIIYRKHGLHQEELEILERYEQQVKAPGASPAKLAARLAKVRASVS